VKSGRSIRDRAGALLLASGSLIVPVAALGYVRADWHRHVPVRIAEGAFGTLLLGFLVWFVFASLRQPATSGVPEPPSVISARAGTQIPHPSSPAAPGRSELLPGLVLGSLMAASGMAYVAHALDLFHHAWA
jgi:hypothetical protein